MRTTPTLLLLALLGSGCAGTAPLAVPDGPVQGPEPLPRVECDFMSVVIDYSKRGEPELAERIVRVMSEEFASLGTRVTDEPGEAYWSLMILASRNATRDGFVFSGLLTSRNMNEGFDPGVTVFAGAPEDEVNDGRRSEKLPTMYNGLSYGTFGQLDDQARAFVRAAYAAVFPTAEQMCAFQAADEEREQTLDRQLPGPPEPL